MDTSSVGGLLGFALPSPFILGGGDLLALVEESCPLEQGEFPLELGELGIGGGLGSGSSSTTAPLLSNSGTDIRTVTKLDYAGLLYVTSH